MNRSGSDRRIHQSSDLCGSGDADEDVDSAHTHSAARGPSNLDIGAPPQDHDSDSIEENATASVVEPNALVLIAHAELADVEFEIDLHADIGDDRAEIAPSESQSASLIDDMMPPLATLALLDVDAELPDAHQLAVDAAAVAPMIAAHGWQAVDMETVGPRLVRFSSSTIFSLWAFCEPILFPLHSPARFFLMPFKSNDRSNGSITGTTFVLRLIRCFAFFY